MNNLVQIGTVAKEAGVNIQTIRYYERRDILQPMEVKDSGYRLYSEDAIKTVRFIKNAQDLGFNLDDIKGLLKLRTHSPSRNISVKKKAKEKLGEVQNKILLLQKIETTLKSLIKNCENNKSSKECPIITGLEDFA